MTLQEQLRQPFHPDEIEWRVAQAGMKDSGPWARVLAYVTARAVMDRLDDVFGIDGWKDEYIQTSVHGKDGFICILSCKIGDAWVQKQDIAECTDIESLKGGVSDALKRAAVKFGIGRYLYHLGESWAKFSKDGIYGAKIDGKFHNWSPPSLPSWALPKSETKEPPKETKKETQDGKSREYLDFRVWVESKLEQHPQTDLIRTEWKDGLQDALKWLVGTGKVFKTSRELLASTDQKKFDESKRMIDEEVQRIIESMTVFN